MTKFKFKLQPVLDHRQKKEDILKKELAEAKQRFESEKLVLEHMNKRLAGLHEELRQKHQAILDAGEVVSYTNYIDRLERDIELQGAKLADIARQVMKVQERLIAAARDKKVLEKLYEKQHEEFKKEFERIEQGLIDELATIRHNRQELSSKEP